MNNSEIVKPNKYTKAWHIICYLIVFALIFAYCEILYTAVSDNGNNKEYTMYYKTHELSRYLGPGELNNYTTETEYIYYNKNGIIPAKNLGRGWDVTEEFGTWAVGSKSDLYFYIEKADCDVILTADISLNAGYKNYLKVNDNYVSDFDADDTIILINIPKEYLTDGVNIISFCTDDYVLRECDNDSSSNDTRLLDLYLRSLGLYENK